MTDLSKDFAPGKGFWWPLQRRRTPVPAVRGITFTIRRRTAVGLVGPAGAGKTALIDLICGVSAPTRGTVLTCGLNPVDHRPALAHRIGIVSSSRSLLWQDLPLEESLRILAQAHRQPEARWRDRRDELVERLELGAFLGRSADRLDPGPRIRGEIAAALIHEPDLLILDEPMLGLDAIGRDRLRSFLRQENRVYGRTLVLASHDLGEIEQICRRLVVIDRGAVVHDGNLAGLINRTGTQRTLVVDLAERDHRLDDIPGTELIGVEAGGLRQRLSFAPGGTPPAQVVAEVAARTGIRHLTLTEPDLTELIARL